MTGSRGRVTSAEPAEVDWDELRTAQLVALAVTVVFSGFSLYLYNGSLPIYLARDRGFSIELVGLLVGIAFVPQLLGPLFAGPLVDRRGPRLALRIGTGLYLLSALLLLISGAGAAIAGARVLQGVGLALVLPAAYTLVPGLVPARFRGTAVGAIAGR